MNMLDGFVVRKNLTIALLFAGLLSCNKPTSPDSSTMQINSLSTMQATPTSVLTINGSCFSTEQPLVIRFSDSSGYQVDVVPFEWNSTQAMVCVPPHFNHSNGNYDSGKVNVMAVQNGTVRSNPICGFNILNLPASQVTPGTITLSFLKGQLAYYDSLVNGIANTEMDTMSSSIKTSMNALANLIQNIESVVKDQSVTFPVANINGTEIMIGSKALSQSDRLILALVETLNRADFIELAPALAKRYAGSVMASGCPVDLTVDKFQDWQNCNAQAPVNSVISGSRFFLGLGAVAIGVLVLAGAAPIDVALASAALLYVGVMTSGIQISLGAELHNINDAVAYKSLKAGVDQVEEMLTSPIKDALISKVFGETIGTLKTINDGINQMRENVPDISSGCEYTLSLQACSFDSNGGNGAVILTTQPGCSWTSEVDNVDWITVTSAESNSGTATVYYSVAVNNTSEERAGTIFIAGKAFEITQTGKKQSSSGEFPSGVPLGEYTVSVEQVVDGKSQTGQPFSITNSGNKAFEDELSAKMKITTDQWLSTCSQVECICGALTTTYSAWTGSSFTMKAGMTVQSSGDCTGGDGYLIYTITKD
jgi:hypothetical protein